MTEYRLTATPLLPSAGAIVECEERDVSDVYSPVSVHVQPLVVLGLSDGRVVGECYLSYVKNFYTAIPRHVRLLPNQDQLLQGCGRAISIGHSQSYVMITRCSKRMAHESAGRERPIVEAPGKLVWNGPT